MLGCGSPRPNARKSGLSSGSLAERSGRISRSGESPSSGPKGIPSRGRLSLKGIPASSLRRIADADLPLDFKLAAFDGKGQTKPVTVRDVVQDASQKVNDREQMSWLLRILAHYEPPTTEWTLKSGEVWSIERLVRHETERSVNATPDFGGPHLFALAVAQNRSVAARKKDNEPLLQS